MKRRQSKPKKEEVRFTKTYFTGDDASMQLITLNEEMKNRENEDEAKVDHHEISLVPEGLSSAWMKNDPYKDLLIKTGLDSMSNREILETLKKKTFGEHQQSMQNLDHNYKYRYCIEDFSNEVKDAIVQQWQRGVKLSRVALMFGISSTTWRMIVNEWKWKKIQEKKTKKMKKLPYRIAQQHIETAKVYMEKNWSKRVTLKQLKNYLESHNDINSLSNTGVHYLQTKVVDYSYTRAHVHPK